MSIKSFTAAIDASIIKTDDMLEKLVRQVCIVAAENTIVGGEFSPGTPVDTGFARSSWWVSINTVDGGPAGVGQAALDAAILSIAQVKVGDMLYLMNNAEYIEALEDGWSPQAPTGFIEITVKNGQAIVDQVVQGLQV